MHMKYFQAIAEIKYHYDDILSNMDRPEWGHRLLKTWDIEPDDKEAIMEEQEVLRYLLGCQLDMVRETNVQKPSIEAVNRCFQRQISFLEKIFRVNDYNINKHSSPSVRKQFKACRHYMFKFSLPAWYEKLPQEILTFDNKYPDFHKKRTINIQ
jgi:hypothetical protein